MIAEAPSADGGSIVFSSFRLDQRAGRLTSAGRPIPLRPKTWAVLLYLVERPGALVTKEELLDAVWRDVAVTPDTLTKSIGELRVALGDELKRPRFIETVHRRGFRFIGKMGEEAASGATGTSAERVFVGRAAELQQLAELYAKACAGERQIVFLEGPAGIGKTALVDAFLDSPPIAGSVAPLWIGRGACIEQHGTHEAYLPVLQALDRLAQRPDADRLVALLRRAAPTWLAQLPWLIGDDAETLRQTLQAARPERMLREFATLTEALTAELTLVLVLEDLHWSDQSTVDLLALLAQRLEPARLLVIGTYRPADLTVQDHTLSPVIHTLRRHRQCVDLPLHDLTEPDVQRYLEARFPGAAIPTALAGAIHRRTDGNPLFIVAVVDHMVARGWILDTAPGWSFVIPPKELEDLGVPDDVRHMIEAELDCLSPTDRRTLEAASVAGHTSAAAAIAGALQCGTEEVESRCEALARSRRFLRVNGSVEWPDGSVARCYTFTHALYRQIAYNAIPEGQRQRLHRSIGEVLETAHGQRAADIAPELAIHFERGGDHARAVRYLAAAADRAIQRFASREAIAYVEAAIGVVARLPDTDERGRQELDLRLALAPLLSDLHGFASDELLDNCRRADDLCAQVGSPAQRFQILYALCHVHYLRADPARAPAAAAELDTLARQLGAPEHLFLANSALARMAAFEGRFVEACRIAEGPIAERLEGAVSPWPPLYGADPVIATNCDYAYALWYLGRVDRARAVMSATLAAAARPGESPFTHATALALTAALEMLCRNVAEARRLAEQAYALSTEYGFAFWNAIAAALRGWARVQDGDLPEACAELERAQAAHAATGARIFSTHILAFRAEAHQRAGQFEAGLAIVDEGLQVAETTLDRSYYPELWRLKGELLLAAAKAGERRPAGRGGSESKAADTTAGAHWRDAEACLIHALDAARGTEAKSLELRAATSLARAWHARGRSAEASAMLGDICRWFGTDVASVDLDDARATLEAIGPAPSSGRRRPTARVKPIRRRQSTTKLRPRID